MFSHLAKHQKCFHNLYDTAECASHTTGSPRSIPARIAFGAKHNQQCGGYREHFTVLKTDSAQLCGLLHHPRARSSSTAMNLQHFLAIF